MDGPYMIYMLVRRRMAVAIVYNAKQAKVFTLCF